MKSETAAKEQVSCRRCGNCCKKGGPALHCQDLALVQTGVLPLTSLITIRKGELAFNPITSDIQPTSTELVKIVGTGKDWDCCYYDNEIGCTIYEKRPHSCRILQCWDIEDIIDLVEKDTITRFDILEKDHPLIEVIKEHDRICSCQTLDYHVMRSGKLSDEQKKKLEATVREDLRFRTRIIQEFDLKLSEELFYFGRPFFQLLMPFGIRVHEDSDGLRLHWPVN